MIEKAELETLIPHRGKMMLLSRVNEYDLKEGTLCAEYHISEDCLFYDPRSGGVPSWVGFEFLAQAISAYSGIRNREMGIKPKMGFILSVPFMRMEIPVYKSGARLLLNVVEKDRTGLIYSFDVEASLGGKKAMEGKLMVMEMDEGGYNKLIMEQSNGQQ